MAKTNGAVKNYDAIGGVALAVAGVTVVWTESFLFEKDVTYSFEFQFDAPGAGVVECDVSLEQGNTAPATEAAASTDMVIPQGKGFILENVGDKIVHVVAYTPVVSNFMRLRIAGTGANNAGTTLERMVVNTVVNA